ncbi:MULTISPECIES: putative bifunctional diguanylate cyclase/phosphodiesterase [Sphingomonas]|uniref:EAL domain-containing protein n=1 Tax=Sphingomonas kyungheensis TaxID=1069987 RepID=A0ABU8GZF5_9SPHN|nr:MULTISPECIES: EAL domain-containing protein [unclassified Sphingomonas]EZP54755.1 Diguanylate cyclase domain protein [Sphingomonas sp. RIT328]
MTGLIFRLRRLRHSDQAIAAAVRETLVESLYASPQSLVIGALTSSAIVGIVAAVSRAPVLIACAVAVTMLAAIRIADAVRLYRRTATLSLPSGVWARRQELIYRLGALGYSALLGGFAMLTLVQSDNGVLHLLAVTMSIGYAAGIAGRNAGRPWIALAQLCFASLPIAIGLIASFDPLKIALAVVILLFIVAMMDITLQTYGVILKATVASREKAALAEHHAAMARRDDLTGVANRTAFREQFETRLQRLAQGDRRLAILWMDLDRFKEINDSFGHLAGNALLAGVARRLDTAFAEEGIVARLGGDEFAVVCAVAQDDEALALGRQILDLVSRPVEHGGRMLHVAASLGIAIAPADGSDADTLLKNADLALYRAKDGGRGQMCLYEPLMDEKIERSRTLAAEMQDALERGEFHLVFQPIYDLSGQRILSCEALLRWTSRNYGPISPAEFIPIAEDNGLIVAIGSWVIREACRLASRWPAEVKIAVNLSPIQLRAHNLPSVIVGALAASGFAADRLELEVTESVLLEDVEASLAALDAINRLHVRTTLDDFGTGYSSLSYLTRFPFQTLKIDRSFIADLEQNPASVAIVQTVIDLAAKLGMRTVAEGVETQAQLDQLRRTRCDAVQGFLLARPIPAEQVTALFAEAAGGRDEGVRAQARP